MRKMITNLNSADVTNESNGCSINISASACDIDVMEDIKELDFNDMTQNKSSTITNMFVTPCETGDIDWLIDLEFNDCFTSTNKISNIIKLYDKNGIQNACACDCACN